MHIAEELYHVYHPHSIIEQTIAGLPCTYIIIFSGDQAMQGDMPSATMILT